MYIDDAKMKHHYSSIIEKMEFIYDVCYNPKLTEFLGSLPISDLNYAYIDIGNMLGVEVIEPSTEALNVIAWADDTIVFKNSKDEDEFLKKAFYNYSVVKKSLEDYGEAIHRIDGMLSSIYKFIVQERLWEGKELWNDGCLLLSLRYELNRYKPHMIESRLWGLSDILWNTKTYANR